MDANPHYALIQYSDERQSEVSLRDLVPTGGVSNPQESPFLEPINFPIDSTDDTLPEDTSEDQNPGDWGDSDTNILSAPHKRERTLVTRFQTTSVLFRVEDKKELELYYFGQ